VAFPQFSQEGVSTVVVFSTGIISPATIELHTNQSWQMSDAGIPYVYTYGAPMEIWVFGFANVPGDIYQDLITFLSDPAVHWREQPFIYADQNSVEFFVQLYDERIQVQQRAIGTYDLALRLLHRTDLEV
jgi:hypothetical protein